MMVAQHCGYTKSHSIIHIKIIKMINFVLWKFYLNKKIMLPKFREQFTGLCYNYRIRVVSLSSHTVL